MSLSPAIRGAVALLFEPVVYNEDLVRQSHDLGFKLYSPASDSEINLATCLPILNIENRILPLS